MSAQYFVVVGTQPDVQKTLNAHAEKGGRPILATSIEDRIVVIVEQAPAQVE